MKKALMVLLILFMLCPAAGCKQNGAEEPEAAGETPAYSAPAVTAAPTPEPTPEPTLTPEPTPTPDPAALEALRIAEEHGLTDDDLRGEYELFCEFAEIIDGNEALGTYGEFVYRIFPVIADHTQYLDKQYFFGRLSTLGVTVCDLDPGFAGQFQFEPNEIFIDSERIGKDDVELPEIIYHELMHFIDYSLNEWDGAEYLLDGRRLTPDELFELPLEERIRATILFKTSVVTEGGAELFTAKYFSNAVRWYFIPCEFLTGLEHIYGSEMLDELYFDKDTDAIFAELIFDAGYTEDEYYDIFGMLNWYTLPASYSKPSREYRPEDVLIHLYEHKLGEGWRTDEEFLYILKSINGVAWSGYETSEYADFLQGIEFETRDDYEAFLAELFADLPFKVFVDYAPPTPIILDGRFMLTAFASWVDPATGEAVLGTIAAEYDFANKKLLSYELIDMGAELNRYFG